MSLDLIVQRLLHDCLIQTIPCCYFSAALLLQLRFNFPIDIENNHVLLEKKREKKSLRERKHFFIPGILLKKVKFLYLKNDICKNPAFVHSHTFVKSDFFLGFLRILSHVNCVPSICTHLQMFVIRRIDEMCQLTWCDM